MHQKFVKFNRQISIKPRRHMRRLWLLGKHPFMMPIVVLIFLVGLAVGLLLWISSRGISLQPPPTDIVIISYDHQTEVVPSHEPTVEALLSKLKIRINPGDIVEPALDTAIHQDDFRINIRRAEPVKIIDGSQTTFALSAATTPRSVAIQAGLTIYPEDELIPQPVSNFLQQRTIGRLVVVKRSTPLTLMTNGFLVATRTQAKTVGAFLASQHIRLNKNDTIEPALNTVIAANETISIIRNGYSLQNVSQQIAAPVQDINDSSLTYGTYSVQQVGSPGQEVLTYRVNVEKGQVVSRTLVQTVITVQPVAQINDVGTSLTGIQGDMAIAGIAPGDYQYASYIISHESGWCPTKWEGEVGYCPAGYSAIHNIYGPDNNGLTYGYGLCQSTPAAKMSSAGVDWAADPITQLRWCNSYAVSKYGGWYNAYAHWINNGNW